MQLMYEHKWEKIMILLWPPMILNIVIFMYVWYETVYFMSIKHVFRFYCFRYHNSRDFGTSKKLSPRPAHFL